MRVSGSGYSEPERSLICKTSAAASNSDPIILHDLHDRVFRAVATAFTEYRVTGTEFESDFMELWRVFRDSKVATSQPVDELFTEVDTFCGDPDLWEKGDLDEEDLRSAAARFLRSQG